jgi:predicted DNA-binding antitoxin AbrB/MazE fold protein
METFVKGGRAMDKLEVEAVYEHGMLKLVHELPLQEGQKVTITIHSAGGPLTRRGGLVPWHGSQEDLDSLILSEENDPLETP